MPRLEGKYRHRKVYRPPGTPFGEAEGRAIVPRRNPAPADFAITASTLIREAAINFRKEFGEIPGQLAGGTVVAEIVFDDMRAVARIMELPD